MKSFRILSGTLTILALVACDRASNPSHVATAAVTKITSSSVDESSVVGKSPSIVDPSNTAQTAKLNQLTAVGSDLYGASARELRQKIGQLQPHVFIANLNLLAGLTSLTQQNVNDRQCKILETISNALPYSAVLYIRKHKQGLTFNGVPYTMFKLNTDKDFKGGYEITLECEAKLGSTMSFGDISAEFNNSIQFISGVTN